MLKETSQNKNSTMVIYIKNKEAFKYASLFYIFFYSAHLFSPKVNRPISGTWATNA